MNKNIKWWYAVPAEFSREKAIQKFRAAFGREPEKIQEPGDVPLWFLGPITNAESMRLSNSTYKNESD